MGSKKESRKEFLRRFGLNLLDKEQDEREMEILTLSEEQLEFLEEYTVWLEDFHMYVKMRNTEPFNVQNNKRLMELSAEAERRKPQLESYMEDLLFSTAFNKIAKEVSEEI